MQSRVSCPRRRSLWHIRSLEHFDSHLVCLFIIRNFVCFVFLLALKTLTPTATVFISQSLATRTDKGRRKKKSFLFLSVTGQHLSSQVSFSLGMEWRDCIRRTSLNYLNENWRALTLVLDKATLFFFFFFLLTHPPTSGDGA